MDALDGRFTDHHAWMCRHLLDQVDHLDRMIAQLDARITHLTREHDGDLALLDTIPGIGPRAAQIILAETGGDMAQFATTGHLASWIGVCPGVNESAGVNKSGKTRDGNGNLKRVLGIAAMSVTRVKDCYLAAFYRRTAARRGRPKALVAVMHKLAKIIWHVLHDQVAYQDLGAEYLTQRDPQQAMRRMQRQANALGMTVRFDPLPQGV